MGRPKSKNPRKESFSVRLTEKENEKLLLYASRHNLTKTQTVIRGIELLAKETDSR